MVKSLLFSILLFCTSFTMAQKIQLGIGVTGNFNALQGYDNFRIQLQDNVGDTIFFNFRETSMNLSYSTPVYVRYQSKFGLWTSLSYATENMNTSISGTSNYSEEFLQENTEYHIQDAYAEDPAGLTYEEYYNRYYDLYYRNEENFWEEKIAYKEESKFHRIHLDVGYSFLRTKKIKPFVSLGLIWNSRVFTNHYQELDYSTIWVDNYSTLYQKMPRLNSNIFFLNLTGGIEVFNIQLGAGVRQSIGNIQEFEHENYQVNKSESDLYKSITSFSLFLRYNLMNFNIRSAEDRKKLKKEEDKVLGDFKEKTKKLKIAVSAEIPLYTDLWTPSDYDFYSDTIFPTSNDSSMFITEDVLILNEKYITTINEAGQLDTTDLFSVIGLDRIKRISILPKINFSLMYAPWEFFSYQTSLGYQYSEFDMEGKFYQSVFDFDNYTTTDKMESFVYRSTLHTISLGQKLNFMFKVSPAVKLGFNVGANINFSIPGRFKSNKFGYNNNSLIEKFDQWYMQGTNEEEWNTPTTNQELYDDYSFVKIEDDGSFTPIDQETGLYDFPSKFWFSWTAGIDIYYDRLKITPFIEGRVININYLYQDYISAGLGITYYLRK